MGQRAVESDGPSRGGRGRQRLQALPACTHPAGLWGGVPWRGEGGDSLALSWDPCFPARCQSLHPVGASWDPVVASPRGRPPSWGGGGVGDGLLPFAPGCFAPGQIGAPGQGRWAELPGAPAHPPAPAAPPPRRGILRSRPPAGPRQGLGVLFGDAGPGLRSGRPSPVPWRCTYGLSCRQRLSLPTRGPRWLEKAAGSRPGDWEGLATRGPQGRDSAVSGAPSSARMCTWTATLHSPRAPFLCLSSTCRLGPATPGEGGVWSRVGTRCQDSGGLEGAGTCEEVRPGRGLRRLGRGGIPGWS